MERRVLIVESQNDFALSMASVLRTAGFQTATAENAADALRELELRRPDLVVLRAELPDQSGFVLCGQIKKGRFGQNLPVLILSSDVGQEGLSQHASGPNAADGYLTIPFEMGELAEMSSGILPPLPVGDDMDESLDAALTGGARPTPTREMQSVPPPLRAPPPGSPPRLPRRERRSAFTEEDRAFLDRTFASIADRKAELLAESQKLRRTPPRREAMGTPEGKIQILRDELKLRESQLARISEIWTVRERELLSVEDRLHEKDVELQGLKMQVDDLLRRFNEAQAAMLQKEREHGATIDDLLLQRFATEKDLIEVVASKEKDLAGARRDLSNREEEVKEKGQAVERTLAEVERLERAMGVATLEFEVKEQTLTSGLATMTGRAEIAEKDLATTREALDRTTQERDVQKTHATQTIGELERALAETRAERASTVTDLEGRLQKAEARGATAEAEVARLQAEAEATETRTTAQVQGLEQRLFTAETLGENLALELEHLKKQMEERLAERDARAAALERELGQAHEQREALDAEMHSQVQAKLEQIGELEGELESTRAQAQEREADLTAEGKRLTTKLSETEASLAAERRARGELEQVHGQVSAERTRTAEALAAAEEQLEQRGHQAAEFVRELEEADGQLRDSRARASDLEARLTTRESELGTTRQGLADTRGALERAEQLLTETRGQLEATTAALAQDHSALEQARAELARLGEAKTSLEAALGETREDLSDHTELLALTKQELGTRVGEVTRLSGQLAQVEDARGNLEEKHRELLDSAARQEELLRGDLAGLTAQLSEAKARLSDSTGERAREKEAAAREAQTRGEQLQKTEARLKEVTDAAGRRQTELSQKLAVATRDGQASKAEAQGRIDQLTAQLTQAATDRDRLRAELGAAVADLGGKLQAMEAELSAERAEAQGREQALTERAEAAEHQAHQAATELGGRVGELEESLQRAETALWTSTERGAARETEARAATEAKARLERDLGGRLQAAEARAADSAQRLAVAEKARKDIEARVLTEREELVGKQRAELERRDAAKAQEVSRLQQSVQERARALKVAELELARLKARAAPAPSATSATSAVRPAAAPAPARTAAPTTEGDEAWQKLVDDLDKP